VTPNASIPVLGLATMPKMAAPEDALWRLVFELARRVEVGQWELVGGLMVVMRGIAAGRVPPRPTGDVDVLADLLSSATALQACVSVVEQLGFQPQKDGSGKVYRFVRNASETDPELKVDILAPDNLPARRLIRTRLNRDTIKIDGGHQALQRRCVIRSTSRDYGQADIPVPDLLGALVLKAAAWMADRRDRDRHAEDAEFLTSLIVDPLAEIERFKGSDGKRLCALDKALGSTDAHAWRQLGPAAADAYTSWRILVDGSGYLRPV
jgi:hypothetical protein